MSQIVARLARLAPHLRPPYGLQVRRFAAYLCLAIALPRLVDPGGVAFILPRLPLGIAFGLLGVLLAVTCLAGRLTLGGRLVAALGFVMFVTLAADAFADSPTSALISLGVALALFGEAVAHADC